MLDSLLFKHSEHRFFKEVAEFFADSIIICTVLI
jgi:hypothetical protein